MPAASTTNDFPFNLSTFTLVHAIQLSNFLTVSCLTLLLYDHAITLDKEIEWIWTLRRGLPKTIFIFNRYVVTFFLLVDCIPEFLFLLPVSLYVLIYILRSHMKQMRPPDQYTSSCNFQYFILLCQPIMGFGSAELLIITRVGALYGNRKVVVWSLRSLFVFTVIGAIVAEVAFSREWHWVSAPKFLPGCYATTNSQSRRPNQWPMWIIFMLCEGILVLLTAYKLFGYNTRYHRTITVLARDSIIYFLIVFACIALRLAGDIDINILYNFAIPTQCATSIAIGRMMMNVRGLVLDDPAHTVDSRTLEFRAGVSTVSAVEMQSVIIPKDRKRVMV